MRVDVKVAGKTEIDSRCAKCGAELKVCHPRFSDRVGEDKDTYPKIVIENYPCRNCIDWAVIKAGKKAVDRHDTAEQRSQVRIDPT